MHITAKKMRLKDLWNWAKILRDPWFLKDQFITPNLEFIIYLFNKGKTEQKKGTSYKKDN